MNHSLRLGFFMGLLLMTSACGRHVVADPETVPSKNQPDWRVFSQPTIAPPTSDAQPPPPPLPPPPPPPS